MKLLSQMVTVVMASLSVATLGIEQRLYHSACERESPVYNNFRWVQYDWDPSLIEYIICGIIVAVAFAAIAAIQAKFGKKANPIQS